MRYSDANTPGAHPKSFAHTCTEPSTAMLADAIREIRTCIDRSEQTRRERRALMAPLRRAELYEHELEELLLGDEATIPSGLARQIRAFVSNECPSLADSREDEVWSQTLPVLDLLFELQEVQQQQLGLIDLDAAEAA